MMKKIAVLFRDGFEELEALSVVDVMRRANIECTMVGMDKLEVTSSHQIKISMDCQYDKTIETYDAVVIPGGMPGAVNLRNDPRVIELIQKFNGDDKIIGAICAGPIVLEKAGVIKGKTVTCYPGFETQLISANYQEALVLKDENIVTGKGPAAALAFAYTLLEALGINSSEIKEGMQYKYLEENI